MHYTKDRIQTRKISFGKQPHRSDLDDDDDEDFPFSGNSGLFCRRLVSKDFDYYLDGYIVEPSAYRELLYCLDSMQEHDTLTMHINSGGGRLDSSMQLTSAMNDCQGKVTAVVSGMAASGASLIALQAPNIIITPNSQMMLHNAFYGVRGKEGEILSKVKFSEKYLDKVIHQAYDGFLTETEIKHLKIGQDFYFDSTEIMERLEKRQRAHEAQLKAKEKANKPRPLSKEAETIPEVKKKPPAKKKPI